MPGKDGTGPQGSGPRGRRMGPCRDTAPENKEQEQKLEGAGITEAVAEKPSTVYGVGRGGKPRGCGMGNCGGRRNG